MIAAAGGIGGGTIYSSVLMAFGAEAHTAVPMAKAIILGGSFILMLINVSQRSKTDPEKPAVQWDLVYFIENAVIMGAIAGSFVNVVLPEWVILTAELLFFTYEGVNSAIKGVRGVKKDRAKFHGAKDVTFDQVVNAEQTPKMEEAQGLLANAEGVEAQIAVKPSACGHWKYVNKLRFTNFVVALLISTGLTIGRSFVGACSTEYWVLLALNFVVGIVAVILNNWSMHVSVRRCDGTVLTGSTSDTFDSPRAMAKFSVVGFLAGVVAAALGIGGGLIKTPLMLSMGIPPYVTRVASSTMIAFTALTSTVQYLVLGQISLSEAWLFMVVVAVLFPLGYFLSEPVIKVVRSTSVIQLAIAAGLLVSDIFVAINAVAEYIDIADSGTVPGFNDICL